MASTVPAKSQPLHNFELPLLKWNKDGNSSGQHQRRRSIKSPSRRAHASSPSPLRHSPLRDSVSATPPRLQSPLSDSAALPARDSPGHGDDLMKQSPIRGESSKPSSVREWMKYYVTASEALRKREGTVGECGRDLPRSFTSERVKNGVHSSNSEQAKEKLEKKSRATEVTGNKRSKLLIRIPCKNNKLEEENPPEESQKIENNDEHCETDEVQEEAKTDEETKTWNLRPRKPIRKSQNATSGAEKGNASGVPEKNKAQTPLVNANKSGEKEGNSKGGGEKKKEKRKLSISIALSKEEIEEDIFAMTGSKPARRPKKRAKNIQKQVDYVFPGLWLVSITPDSYKVSENYLKG